MATLIQAPPRVRVETGIDTLPPPAADDAAQWSRFYEDVYHEAGGDPDRIPWAHCMPNPALREWLTDEAPTVVRPGALACAVGCGLGDDVRELADRGYDVLAFDVSPTAVQWARVRYPDLAEQFVVADLFQLPSSLLRRFDLVVEVNTLQAVHPGLRARAGAGIASLARPRGTVLAICRGRDEASPLPDAPPYPLSPRELCEAFAPHGLLPTHTPDEFDDDEAVRRVRATFKRG
jgi:SAM-dependent methyltransferase